MARLTRYLQKIFASNPPAASDVRVYGSLAAGSPANAATPDDVQSLGNYLEGWTGAIIGQDSPAMEDMNALQFLWAYQLAYLMQSGVPEWKSTETYYIGQYAMDTGVLYRSLVNTNLNNAVTDVTKWKPLSCEVAEFVVNGPTSTFPTFPFLGIDQPFFCQESVRISSIVIYNGTAGAGGTTEFDLKVSAGSGSPFVSALSTTGKIVPAAGNGVWTDSGTNTPAQTGVIKPVISTFLVPAGGAFRFDMIQSMTGAAAADAKMVVFFNPLLT